MSPRHDAAQNAPASSRGGLGWGWGVTPSSRFCLLLLGASLAAAATVTVAQSIADPTRPAVGSGATDGPASMPKDAAANLSGLQSVFLRKHGKSGALINGEYVEQGGHVGDSVLLKVGENFVVLKGPGGKEVLMLTPSVDKRSAGGTGKAVMPTDVQMPEKNKGKTQ